MSLIHHEWFPIVLIGALIWIFLFGIVFWMLNANVYGDDTEDKGRTPLYDQFLERVEQWNMLQAMNETEAIIK